MRKFIKLESFLINVDDILTIQNGKDRIRITTKSGEGHTKFCSDLSELATETGKAEINAVFAKIEKFLMRDWEDQQLLDLDAA